MSTQPKRYADAPRLPDDVSIDPRAIVGASEPIELEIGPGRGGFLLERLATSPEIRIIGLEIRRKWATVVDQRIQALGLGSRARVFAEDARDALKRFAPESVSRAFVHFPDPWWKKRHHKRLVLASPLLDELARVLVPGGDVFVQTDVEERAVRYEALFGDHPAFQAGLGGARVHENPYGARSPRERRAMVDGLPVLRLLFRKLGGPVAASEGSIVTRVLAPVRVTVDEAAALIALCGDAESKPQSLTLDLARTTHLDPVGAAILTSILATRRLAGRETSLVLPMNAEASAFVSEIGLDGFAEGRATGIGTLEVRQMKALDATYTDAVAGILARGVPGITSENSYPIQLCLNELLQNVFEWAESRVGCFVLTRWYHRTRSVRIAVVDRGIGIPAALRRSSIEWLKTAGDADIVEKAVSMPRLTSRAGSVGGYGLKNVREVAVEELGGRLTIFAGTAKLVWFKDTVESTEMPSFHGTAIEVELLPETAVERPREYVPVF